MTRTYQAIGTSLSVWSGKVTHDLSNNFSRLFRVMESNTALDTDIVDHSPVQRFFTSAVTPTTDTAIYSPGADICFIWDLSGDGNDLYMVYDWVDATHFTVQLIVGTA